LSFDAKTASSYQGKESDESAQIWHGLASYMGGAKQRSQSLFKIEPLFTLRMRPLILD
jgi:hypothetical protein